MCSFTRESGGIARCYNFQPEWRPFRINLVTFVGRDSFYPLVGLPWAIITKNMDDGTPPETTRARMTRTVMAIDLNTQVEVRATPVVSLLSPDPPPSSVPQRMAESIIRRIEGRKMKKQNTTRSKSAPSASQKPSTPQVVGMGHPKAEMRTISHPGRPSEKGTLSRLGQHARARKSRKNRKILLTLKRQIGKAPLAEAGTACDRATSRQTSLYIPSFRSNSARENRAFGRRR